MSAIYILWLRELKRYTRSRAQIIASLGQPLLYLLVLGFGLGPVFKRAGNGNYSAVRRARRHRHVGAVLVHLLRPRPALGPPVRLSERDAGGSGAAHADHDRPHARRMHRGRHPGPARYRPSVSSPASARRTWFAIPVAHRIHGAHRHTLRGAGRGHRLGPSGHAGLSAHHELPGHAHLLSVGRHCSRSTMPGKVARYHHAARSALLRHRRHALRASARLQRPAFGTAPRSRSCSVWSARSSWSLALSGSRRSKSSDGPTAQYQKHTKKSSAPRSICSASAASRPPAWTRSRRPRA